jgi:epoxide hydrolase
MGRSVVTHGWPGSVMEFLDVLHLLTEDFHVVAPSLPGFTFSGVTSVRGWHPRRVAMAFAEVMARLDYDRYGAQGGDWGSLVSANLADLHADRVVGSHLKHGHGTHSLRAFARTCPAALAFDAASTGEPALVN